MSQEFRVSIGNEGDLETFADRLASHLQARSSVLHGLIGLTGPLGSGKTRFTRALLRSLGGPSEEVHSPTFSLVHEMEVGAGHLVHLDLYRLPGSTTAEVEEEMEHLAIRDLMDGQHLIVMEWADRLDLRTWAFDLLIEFQFGRGATERVLILKGLHLPKWP